MAWREEKTVVEEALTGLLPRLSHPHLSMPLATRLAPLVQLPEPRIRKILLWLAKEGHPHATHDGGTVRSYGRIVTRWRWHPAPQRLPVGSLEARLNAAGVVDTQDW
jgi:hypothetical protein